MIEKLKNFDSVMKKKNEKIEELEGKLKDTNLKVFEQNKEIEMIIRNYVCLKKMTEKSRT